MYTSKKWTGKAWVFTKRLKGISNFVCALIEKKNGRKVLTRVFDFIQLIRSSGTIKVMLATNPIIVGRFSWYLALPPREHHYKPPKYPELLIASLERKSQISDSYVDIYMVIEDMHFAFCWYIQDQTDNRKITNFFIGTCKFQVFISLPQASMANSSHLSGKLKILFQFFLKNHFWGTFVIFILFLFFPGYSSLFQCYFRD